MMLLAPRLAMVAGEASGDLLASLLLRGLRERWPQTAACGIGGPLMQAEGFEAWWPSRQLSVFGYADALRRLPELLRLRRQLGQRLLDDPPQVFIGVDAPDFNFGLERRLRAAGVPTVHFVCPSIWAWRPERVKTIAAAAQHVLCLFPFEPELLARHGIAATYVGHPLADQIPMAPSQAAARQKLGLAAGDTVVALLPGSRRSEIMHIAPVLLQAAAVLHRARPELRFVLPAAPGLRPDIQALLLRHASGLAVQVLDGCSHDALAACDVALAASGTATLEAALFKRPMVVVYRVGRLNEWIMKNKALLPWISLPNILLREFAVPELIQHAATPEAIAAAALAWLDDAPRRQQLAARFTELHHTLRCDTARRSSDALSTLLQAG